MKKRTLNAFTLVEMLIVIVIIGILIAALMPRMQAAQGRARDVSRKTALSQIQSAIVVSQGDLGKWPGTDCSSSEENAVCATDGVDVDKIEDQLKLAGMNGTPKDPLDGNEVTGLGAKGAEGQYRYMVTTRNGTPKGGFVLMAKTEVAGGSNWVVCSDSSQSASSDGTPVEGHIFSNTDISTLTLCEKVTVDKDGSCSTNTTDCVATSESQLRYIAVY